MSVYKSLTTSDVVVTPFKANKSFSFQGSGSFTSSNIGIDRFLGKIVTAFTPEGDLTKSLFASQKVMEGFKASDLNRATELIRELDKGILRAFPQMQEVLDRSLKTKEKEKFYKELNTQNLLKMCNLRSFSLKLKY